MKLMKKLTPVALATSMAVGGLAVPGVASAEMSANLGIANMYLWRGQNLTPDGPQVHGGLEYAAESGVYGGIWATNETGGHETDLYLGYGGEAGSVSYDISYWEYLYPEDGDLSDTRLSEFILGAGVGDFAANLYISSETQGASDYYYFTVDYTISDFNILVGTWSFDDDVSGLDAFGDPVPGDEYTHLTVTYSITDDLSLAVSVASSDDDTTEEDPLFVIAYNIPIEMK